MATAMQRWIWRRAIMVCLGVLAVLGGTSGCARTMRPTLEQRESGLVYVIHGVEGNSPLCANIAKGLRSGGWQGATEIFCWGTGAGFFDWYRHLSDRGRNREQAHDLARMILRYQAAFPGRPVHLIAHSGGAGIALVAVEALPEGRYVDSVILLGAAVSPERDLRRALTRTRRGIWSFSSSFDVAFLAAGTAIFGTTDGHHGPAAGMAGFRVPEFFTDQDRALYAAKLHQVPYRAEMARSGHLGSHLGWAGPRFAADWLAPLLADQGGERRLSGAVGGAPGGASGD